MLCDITISCDSSFESSRTMRYLFYLSNKNRWSAFNSENKHVFGNYYCYCYCYCCSSCYCCWVLLSSCLNNDKKGRVFVDTQRLLRKLLVDYTTNNLHLKENHANVQIQQQQVISNCVIANSAFSNVEHGKVIQVVTKTSEACKWST